MVYLIHLVQLVRYSTLVFIKYICVKSGLATPNGLTCATICHRQPNLDDNDDDDGAGADDNDHNNDDFDDDDDGGSNVDWVNMRFCTKG